MRSGLPALEARRGGHANTALNYLAASEAVLVCGVCFLIDRKDMLLEVLSLWPTWKKYNARLRTAHIGTNGC